MFRLFKKKKVNTQKIRDFNEAVNAINVFILLSEWEKARHSLTEVRVKEKESFDMLMEKINKEDDKYNQKEKDKQIRLLKKRNLILDRLEHTLDVKEKNYKDKAEINKFKIRFKKIKQEIVALSGNKKNTQALNLLQKFLEENKEKKEVLRFFNKEKKSILKSIEKNRKKEQDKIKKNARLEALKLIGHNINLWWNKQEEETENNEKEKKVNIIGKLKQRLHFYKNLKERIRKKKLLDEIEMLIEEDSKVKNDIAAKKLANIHKWLIKELSNDNIVGYELYGKILWADKISGDTFGFNESKNKYNFFLWDATGHGIRAGFIITLLTRLFNKYVESSNLQELTYEINNGLKQDLKSRNFITWIFFEIQKDIPEKVNFVGMGHEPMLIYRQSTKSVEKIIPGWLAAWIRIIKEKNDIKIKDIILEDGDVLLVYSDGIIESKNAEGELFWLNRLTECFNNISKYESDIYKIYDYIIKEVQIFRGWSRFDDDTSTLIVKRNTQKDIQNEDSKYLQDISLKEGLRKKDLKKLEGKSKEQIEKELEGIRKEKETQRIVKILENLYYTWEILKLKQEAIRFIKEGFIHKKINFYLKKAIDNEKEYKIEQKNQKIENKYNVLKQLYKKWDFTTVIKEAEEIISKDGNI